MNAGNVWGQNTYYAIFLEYGDLIPETIRITQEAAEQAGRERFGYTEKPEELFKHGLCLGKFSCVVSLSQKPEWIKGFRVKLEYAVDGNNI